MNERDCQFIDWRIDTTPEIHSSQPCTLEWRRQGGTLERRRPRGRSSALAAWGATFLFAVLSGTAWADPPTACELGAQLRKAVGLGPDELATLSVNQATHEAIAADAATYCNANRETVEPLLSGVQTARANWIRAYEFGTDIQSVEQALLTAINNVASSAASVITTMRNRLTEGQQALFDHLASNRLLDVRVACLDLTSEQRTALRAAQRNRDAILLHHKDRKNPTAIQAAATTWNLAVAEVLSTDQETQSATIQSAVLQNSVAAATVEAGTCE